MFPSFRNKEVWNMLNKKIESDLTSLDLSICKPYQSAHIFSKWLKNSLDDLLKDFKNTEIEKKEYYRKSRERVLKNKAPFLGKQINHKSPTCSIKEMEKHFRKTFSLNVFKFKHIHEEEIEIEYEFNKDPITVEELQRLIEKSSSDSKDYYGLSYGIIKKLPSIHQTLCDIFNRLISDIDDKKWTTAIIYAGYKKGDTIIPDNFRPLMKFPILTRIYNRWISQKLFIFLSKNKILNMEVQRGYNNIYQGVFNNVTSCKYFVKDAIEEENDIAIVFLDIKNAYGSIHYEFIKKLMKMYRVPEEVADYIYNYYVSSGGYLVINKEQSDYIKCEKGLHQGCAIGNILFIMCFNFFLKILIKKYSYGYTVEHKEEIYKTFLLAFIDDVSVITKFLSEAIKVCNDLDKLLKKYDINLSYGKCRYLEIKQETNNGFCSNICKFFSKPKIPKINNHVIKKLTLDDHFKYLGSTILLNQEDEIKLYQEELTIKLQKVDDIKSPVSNADKIYLYKNFITKKIMWDFQLLLWDPMLIKEIELTYLKKWFVKDPENYLKIRNERIISRRIKSHIENNSKSLEPFSQQLLEGLDNNEIEQHLQNVDKIEHQELGYEQLVL